MIGLAELTCWGVLTRNTPREPGLLKVVLSQVDLESEDLRVAIVDTLRSER